MSVILITGYSTGLGFATAETMARAGHQVYATMRNPNRAPNLVNSPNGITCPSRFCRWMSIPTNQ